MTQGNKDDVKTEAEINEIIWRINFQILAMQYAEYKQANTQEKEQWKIRIWETLCRTNQRAQLVNPQELPQNLRPPTADYLALNAGANWCLRLSRQLTLLFMSA